MYFLFNKNVLSKFDTTLFVLGQQNVKTKKKKKQTKKSKPAAPAPAAAPSPPPEPEEEDTQPSASSRLPGGKSFFAL